MGDGSDSQTDYVHKVGLINREMASREGQNLLENLGDPFWGTFRTRSVLAEPFGPPKT